MYPYIQSNDKQLNMDVARARTAQIIVPIYDNNVKKQKKQAKGQII